MQCLFFLDFAKLVKEPIFISTKKTPMRGILVFVLFLVIACNSSSEQKSTKEFTL